MIALTITLGLAVYLFGPDAFSRFLLDFSVPRRAITLTRSEEVYRAVIWSGTSLTIALIWAWAFGTVGRVFSSKQIQTCFSGLYSEQFFRENRQDWFASLHAVMWMNWCILWRLYVAVFALSMILYAMIHFYAKMRHKISGPGLCPRTSRRLLAAIVLPRIAPWHLLLSRILLYEDELSIHIDVLTKMDILYQGQLADKMLAADGSLVSVTLADPRRFNREQYLEDKKNRAAKDSADYWKRIPTNIFVIMVSEVHTINLRYKPDAMASLKDKGRAGKRGDLDIQLDAIGEALKVLRKAHKEMGPKVFIDSTISESDH
jgi:hypothetical protein